MSEQAECFFGPAPLAPTGERSYHSNHQQGELSSAAAAWPEETVLLSSLDADRNQVTEGFCAACLNLQKLRDRRLCATLTFQDVHPDQFRQLWATPDLPLEMVLCLDKKRDTCHPKHVKFTTRFPLLHDMPFSDSHSLHLQKHLFESL